ncbi:hypothetical protein EON77_01265 [bacterium]|nr:MAG: hypothetical protein EON77_01265 [bacterium]
MSTNVRAQKRAIARDAERERKKGTKAKLAELREKLKAAHAQEKDQHRAIAMRCRAERERVRAKLREMRERVLRELRETAAIEREAARAACFLRKREACGSYRAGVSQARAELEAERAYQADLRRLERANRARHAERVTAHVKAERRGESDDEVRQNIPADLVPLFEKVKRGIKASPVMSRSEAFLHYAEEHPDEVFALLDAKTEREIRRLEHEHATASRAVHTGARRAPSPPLPPNVPRRRYSAAELAEVPF